MKNVLNFFKGKRYPYFIMMADAVLALFVGIYFLATKDQSLANSASVHAPDTVWIFAFVGVIFEIAALIVPRYKWVHILATAAYCLSFMKEVQLIPPVIADEANNVHFQGGSLPIQLVYLITLIVIIISAIVALFANLLTKEGYEGEPKITEKKGIAKAGAASVLCIGGLVMALILVPNAQKLAQDESTNVYDPLASFREKVQEYEHDPLSIKYKQGAEEGDPQKNPYEGVDGNTISNALNNRDGHWLVYEFEGKYTEAYHQQESGYAYNYYSIQVYEDGVFKGSNNHRGYWFNINSDGIDCLVLKATSGSDMVCSRYPDGSPYMWYTDLNTGNRTCKMNGYMYYPIIGIYIDTNGLIYKNNQVLEYEFNSSFSHDLWSVMIVRNNLNASAVFNPDEITWKDIDTMVFGEQKATASWKEWIAEVPCRVTADKVGQYTFDASGLVKKDYRLVDIFEADGIAITRTADEQTTDVDASRLPVEYDVAGNKVKMTIPNGEVKEIPVTFHTDAASNTITGTIGGVDATVVVTSRDKANITVGGNSCVANIELTGTKGLARIKIVSKADGSDDCYNALPKTISIEEKEGQLRIQNVKYYASNDKMNNSSSQDGKTYFAIGNEDFLTAFWHWVYQGGDECFIFKCTYTKTDTSIVLTSCLEDPRDEWQWCRSNDRSHAYPITEIAYEDIPENLTSRLTIYE